MSNQLQKALNLAKKTGDKLIVFDSPSSQNAYVVMNLEQYEKIVAIGSGVRDLTEEELVDKINRDIAIWKSEQDFLNSNNNDGFSSDKTDLTHISEMIEEKKRNPWAIPDDRKQAAEEIIEEDRQYLEEIRF